MLASFLCSNQKSYPPHPHPHQYHQHDPMNTMMNQGGPVVPPVQNLPQAMAGLNIGPPGPPGSPSKSFPPMVGPQQQQPQPQQQPQHPGVAAAAAMQGFGPMVANQMPCE